MQAGLDKALQSNALAVIVGSDKDSSQAGPLTLIDGVSVITGYAPGFIRDLSRRVLIEAEMHIYGVFAKDITKSTHISGLDIITKDAPVDGFSNCAVYAVNSPGLILSDIQAKAGRGGAGRNGVNGATGADGQDGKNADVFRIAGRGDIYTAGGGGENIDCPEANGGRGGHGKGVDPDFEIDNSEPTAGEDGKAALGGQPGRDEVGKRNGNNGESALTPVESGKDGTGGTSGGQIVNDRWQPREDSSSGTPGINGSGGGGSWSVIESPKQRGASGSGGGAGGCGGSPGMGGKSGGGSFGLFALSSNLRIVGSTFVASMGGAGGDGGQGGEGGKGGAGGAALNTTPSAGGGGNGAGGTRGGRGGGGAGGVSYGAYCHQSVLNVTDTSWQHGGSAAGGGGGQAEAGVAMDSYQCGGE